MTDTSIRLLLVDDDPLVRQALAMMFARAPDIHVVGEVADGDEVLTAVDECVPDVVLMDIRMHNVDGLAATAALHQHTSRPPRVLVLTTFDADPHVLDALRAGATGFLPKHTAPARIVDAVRATAAGDRVLSPTAIQKLIDSALDTSHERRRGDAIDRMRALTERERDVAARIAAGHTNPEIAGQLHLSTATIKVHVAALLSKLSLTNRTQIAVLFHEARGS